MFDRLRSDWLPEGEPFTGPALQPARIDQIIIHYIGTDRAPRESGRWMLNEHRRTMSRENPYAFMYNAHVALDGKTWQGRGLEFRNAANGAATNATTWSIVFGVDGQNSASPEQIAGARKLIDGIRKHVGRYIPLVPHRAIKATQCPGDGITAQIKAGEFEQIRSGEMYTTTNPTRVLDTRRTGTVLAGRDVLVSTNLPAGAFAAHVNITGLFEADGYLSAYSSTRPDASVLNGKAGAIVANAVTVQLNPQRQFKVWTFGPANILVDVMGYHS